MSTWPTILPNPSQSYSYDADFNTLRSKMDSGRIRQRSRFSKTFLTVKVRWQFNDFQLAVFQSWFTNTINGGTDWFDTCPLILGDSVQNYTARFVGGKYSTTHEPVLNWVVSASLEVEDPDFLGPEYLEFLLAEMATGETFADVESVVDRFHELVHTTLPTEFP